MKLQDYYKDWKKVRVSYANETEALEAVKQDGDALQYVWASFFEQE